jgi:hypothetical protein
MPVNQNVNRVVRRFIGKGLPELPIKISNQTSRWLVIRNYYEAEV